jgi:hypothetical protein
VDAEDIGEGSHVEGVDKSNVGVDVEDVIESPHAKSFGRGKL